MTEKKNKIKQPAPEQDSGQSSGDIDDAVPAKDILPDNKIDPKEHKKKTKKGKPRKEKQSISKIALLSLLVAVFASVGMGYEYVVLQEQQQLTARILSSQNRLEQDIKNTSQALDRESRARKNSENEFLSFKTSIEAVATKLGRTSNEWRMAEVEYLLTIANHRLTLARDRLTAMTIFENADQKIKQLGDPALLKIRKLIKEELLLLNAVKEPDLAGMALSLGSLAAKVEDLPLVDKERVAVATGQIKDQAPQNWQEIPAAVWKDIKSLVVVRRHQQPTEPLLPPAESWFLVQNLRLKLEQARLALLRGDTNLFRQNLNEANSWMSTYFNEESPGVINALKQTSNLAKVELRPAIPDVSGSLRQLRSLLVERGVKFGSK
jgi:uroporphyrin-3 C-methyltransferase